MDIYYQKLADRLKAVIEAHPNKVAYIQGGREVTYSQLDDMANHIAAGVARKVQAEAQDSDVPVRIGIALGRDEAYVPCILAAVKLGCSYVPIDVETPQDRRDFIAKDAQLGILISSQNLGTLLDSPLMEQLPLLSRGVSEAYMIYTSGTTGLPKGVSQPYRTLYSYMLTVCLAAESSGPATEPERDFNA